MEAASSGLPFVIVNDNAFEGMVKNNVNGLMLPLKKEEFVEKILTLVQNKSLREEFGRESKVLIKKNFDPDKLTKEFINFYKKAINEKN